MAIKERLLKQLNIVRDGLRAMPPFHSRDLNAMRNALVQARDLCFQGLSENHFAEYKDTYDGLLLATEQLAADAPDKDEIVSLCSELLQYMIAQTQKETSFKKEIFFLPYKASMWDSLESVWKAADEDKEHCIAYVMPIPYADLTPEHNVAEWHYERGMFPEDVPTVNWEDFDLQEMHPDVIFIHNPYDEYNRVTSVESRFYSSKLKDQADKLVYIPYFVLAEPELDGKSEEEIEKIEEGIEGFVLTPAVLNAHQVIVQSEAMREVYINVLTRKTDKTDRTFWEKHILGTGSPKFDKVANSRKEDFYLPKEWQKLISGKKTILYNTGLSAMLAHTDKFIEKIRAVLEEFKAQDDVVLWWRPHPLLRSTFEAMHPELLEDYDKIVASYRQEGWGIYDDTADLDRAVTYTDGYYGDWSSVVQLYEKTGKKVFIQNCTNEHGSVREFNGNTHFMDVVRHCGYVYFSETSFNGLFRYQEGDSKAEFLGRFPFENPWQGDLHRNVFVRGDRLYFIPLNGHGISVYDCVNEEFSLIKISDDYSLDEYIHYVQCIEYDDKVLMIPINLYTPFAVFDFTEEKIKCIPQLNEKLSSLLQLPSRYELFSLYSAILRNNYLYLLVNQSNMVLKICLDDLNVSKFTLPVKIHLRYMNFIDGLFYFSAKEHVMISWNDSNGECKKYVIPCEVTDDNYPYLLPIKLNNCICLISGREDRLWNYNKISESWVDFTSKLPASFERELHGSLLFIGYKYADDNQLILYPRAGNGMLILGLQDERFTFKAIRYNSEVGNQLQKGFIDFILSNNAVLFEWDIILTMYIDFINTCNVILDDKSNNVFATGRKIYSEICE